MFVVRKEQKVENHFFVDCEMEGTANHLCAIYRRTSDYQNRAIDGRRVVHAAQLQGHEKMVQRQQRAEGKVLR